MPSSPLHAATRAAGKAAERFRAPPRLAGWPAFAQQEPGQAGRVRQPDDPEFRCLIAARSLDSGGLPVVAAFLARHLPAHGIATEVVDVREDGSPTGPLGRALMAEGIPVRAVLVGTPLWEKAGKPAVVSAHGFMPQQMIQAAGREGVPWVETLHGMHDLMGASPAGWAREARRAFLFAGLIGVSATVSAQYLAGVQMNPQLSGENMDFLPGRAATVPNGLHPQAPDAADREALREHLGLREEDFLFVSLARHATQKNTYGLVAAFGEVARRFPRAHLAIAGGMGAPGYVRRVLRLRDSLPGRDRIHIRGHLGNRWGLLAAADGFVLNSFFEGWALTPMEALCTGVPVVLSEVAGAWEQVGGDPFERSGGDRARGLVVPGPAGDPTAVTWDTIRDARYAPQANHEAVVAAMGQLIEHREWYSENRKALAEESADRFSGDVCAGRHAAVLRRAVTRGAVRYPKDPALA